MAGTEYREWSSSSQLAADVMCLWRGHVGDTGSPYTDRVLPDGCVDVIWDGARVFVAGPDTRPVLLPSEPNRTFVGIRMRPGRAASVLGCPAAQIRDRRIDLAELWGQRRVAELTDHVAASDDPATIGPVLEGAVYRQLARSPGPDRVVDGLVSTLRTRACSAPGLVEMLAAELGVTARSLHRRCCVAVGYGPKTLDRVLRFRRAQALARRDASLRLGELAVEAGYADQAHLTRECRRLSGLTPSELFKTATASGATLSP